MHRLQANSNSALIAGSESGVTYLLLFESRSSKKSSEGSPHFFNDIILTSVSWLTYLPACLNEALRSYPPVSFGMPRFVPKGGAKTSGGLAPEGVGPGLSATDDIWTDPQSKTMVAVCHPATCHHA